MCGFGTVAGVQEEKQGKKRDFSSLGLKHKFKSVLQKGTKLQEFLYPMGKP